jgi:hypothetical protein
LATATVTHAPVALLHEAAWHGSGAAQATGFEPTQEPPTQVSDWVHASPSLHAVPLARAGFEHAPVDGLHVPAPWHWSDAVQVTGLPAAQIPDWHASAVVHALPSLHVVPLGTL